MRGSATMGGGSLLGVKTSAQDTMDNYVRALFSGYNDGGFNQALNVVMPNILNRCNEFALLYDLLREENYRKYVQLVTTQDFSQYSFTLSTDNIVHKFLNTNALSAYNMYKAKSGPITWTINNQQALSQIQQLIKNLQTSGSNFLSSVASADVTKNNPLTIRNAIPSVITQMPLTVSMDAVFIHPTIKTATIQVTIQYKIDDVTSEATQTKILQSNAAGNISISLPLLPTMSDVKIIVASRTDNVSFHLTSLNAYYGTNSQMLQTGLFTEQTNVLVVRRLLLLYMYMSMFMIARRLDLSASPPGSALQTQAFTQLRTNNQNIKQQETGPANDFRDVSQSLLQKMNSVNAESRALYDVTSSVANIKTDVLASDQAVTNAKTTSTRISILSWVFFVILLGIITGAVIMHMIDDPVSKGMIAVTILAVAVTLGIVTMILRSYFWSIETFEDDVASLFYSEVDKYLDNTMLYTFVLQNNKAYDMLGSMLTKNRAEADNAYQQIVQGVSKMDSFSNLMTRKRIFAHARIVLFVNLMIIIAATAFLIGIVHNSATQKLIYVIAAIFTALALSMYIVETNKRVNTRSPQYYWSKPDMSLQKM